MGTRGAYGFRINNQDKLTYNHWDSYPTGLGADVAQFVRSTSKAEMLEIARAVQLVNEDTPPTREQIAECEVFADTSVSTGQLTEWYVLLRRAQGSLDALKNGLKYLIEGNAFVRDSLFCEWAYVIDVDLDVLEIYKGFQETLGDGRYNREFPVKKDRDGKERKSDYTGVALMQAVPMGVIRALSEEEVKALLDAIYKTSCATDASAEDEDDEDVVALKNAKALLAKLLDTPPQDVADEHIATESRATSPAEPDDADILREIYDSAHDGLTVLPPDLLEKLEAHFNNKASGD